MRDSRGAIKFNMPVEWVVLRIPRCSNAFGKQVLSGR